MSDNRDYDARAAYRADADRTKCLIEQANRIDKIQRVVDQAAAARADIRTRSDGLHGSTWAQQWIADEIAKA